MGKGRPRIVVSGFVALDIIVNEASERPVPAYVAAGGSACNIAVISHFLGLESTLVAEIGSDTAGDVILRELQHLSVDHTRIRRSASFETPIVLERLRKSARGIPTHRFELRCRQCGIFFPRFRGSSLETMRSLSADIHRPDAFVFDRVTPAIIDLACRLKAEGAMIAFEPSGSKPERLFKKAAQLSNLVKYAADRIDRAEIVDILPDKVTAIETNGEHGLEIGYWSRGARRFRKMKAIRPTILRDATGSGDWLTAGILQCLLTSGMSVSKAGIGRLEEWVRFGQALASLNAAFTGARGLMEGNSAESVIKSARRLATGKSWQTVPVSLSLREKRWTARAAFQSSCHGV